jgi:hypothetical protein
VLFCVPISCCWALCCVCDLVFCVLEACWNYPVVLLSLRLRQRHLPRGSCGALRFQADESSGGLRFQADVD